MGNERWEDLGRRVVDRRVELGWRTREAFVEVSGLSRKTLGEIERGDRVSYDPATLATVEQTLKWAPGTIGRLVRHNDYPIARPIMVDDDAPQVVQDIAFLLTPDAGLSDSDRANLRRGLEHLVSLWIALADKGGTPDFSMDTVEQRAIPAIERLDVPEVPHGRPLS